MFSLRSLLRDTVIRQSIHSLSYGVAGTSTRHLLLNKSVYSNRVSLFSTNNTNSDDEYDIPTTVTARNTYNNTSDLDSKDREIRVRNLPSASVAHLDPDLLSHIDKTSWLPARRKRTPLPPGLPQEAVNMIQEFEMKLPIPLHEDTIRILALPKKLGGFGFSELSVVQQNTISPIAQGVDVLVRAPTGTGKTLAYVIPILERLIYMRYAPESKAIPVIIMCPTRELCLQTAAVVKHVLGLHERSNERKYGVTCVVGGTSSLHVEQEPLMQNPCAILIGTPQRINEHIVKTPGFKKRIVDTKVVVMDEVDYLLRSNTSKDISNIMSIINRKKQTILFSATLNASVRAVAKYSLRAGHEVIDLIKDEDQPIVTKDGMNIVPEDVELQPDTLEKELVRIEENDEDDEVDDELMLYASTPEKAKQYVVEASSTEGLKVIARLLDDIGGRFLYAQAEYLHQVEQAELHGTDVVNEKPKPPKILIFAPTARYAQFVSLVLRKVTNPGKSSAFESILELHSKKNQNYRVRVAESFASTNWTKGVVLCSSDIAARGMDFKEVDLVIHLGMAPSRAQYIHRVGRTARAQSSGTSLLLVDPLDVEKCREQLHLLPLQYLDYSSLMLDYNDDKALEEIYATEEEGEMDVQSEGQELSTSESEQEYTTELVSDADSAFMDTDIETDGVRAANAQNDHDTGYMSSSANASASEREEGMTTDMDVDADESEEGEELWDGVLERACAPLEIVKTSPSLEIREKRLKTLYGQTMCVNSFSALQRNKTYEYMLSRVLRKVPHDDELGLNAERTYVSMLGLWRIPKANNLSKQNTLTQGLDKVTTNDILSPEETGRRALQLAKGLGILGEHGELPSPNIAERVAKRLGLVGIPGISVGVPKTYQLSATEQQRPPSVKKKHFRPKEPAPFREYYDKHATFKTMPRRVRTGELGYKVRRDNNPKNHSTDQ